MKNYTWAAQLDNDIIITEFSDVNIKSVSDLPKKSVRTLNLIPLSEKVPPIVIHVPDKANPVLIEFTYSSFENRTNLPVTLVGYCSGKDNRRVVNINNNTVNTNHSCRNGEDNLCRNQSYIYLLPTGANHFCNIYNCPSVAEVAMEILEGEKIEDETMLQYNIS